MTALARRFGGWNRDRERGEWRRLRPAWSELAKLLLLSFLFVLALCRVATAGPVAVAAEDPEGIVLVASSEASRREARTAGIAVPRPAKPVQPAIVYQPPRRGSPERGKVGGGVRGGSRALATPLALVPDHLAYTVNASPSIFWHVDGPVDGARVFFSIVDEEDLDGLDFEVELESPTQAGIHRVRLSDLGITLAGDTEYHWYISVVPDMESRDRDRISDGYVSRIDEPLLDGHDPVASTFAELGLWYDALESLSDAIDSDPADLELRVQRNSLLLQAGLEVAAR
jgi:hypothetical protein